jgi:hypothetical protein
VCDKKQIAFFIEPNTTPHARKKFEKEEGPLFKTGQ